MLEILVVVVILSIASSIAVVSYGGFRQSLGVDVSANVVQRTLMQARSRAINLNKVQQVFLDLDNGLVWVDELECISVENTAAGCTSTEVEVCRLGLDDPCCADVDVDCLAPQLTDCCFAQRIRTSMVVQQEPLAENTVIDSVTIGEGATPETSGLVAVAFYPDGSAPYVGINIRRTSEDASVEENFTAVRLYPASGEAQVLKETKL